MADIEDVQVKELGLGPEGGGGKKICDKKSRIFDYLFLGALL